ncbi:MAG: hypothetical protein WCG25_07430 [bacterium]
MICQKYHEKISFRSLGMFCILEVRSFLVNFSVLLELYCSINIFSVLETRSEFANTESTLASLPELKIQFLIIFIKSASHFISKFFSFILSCTILSSCCFMISCLSTDANKLLI